MGKKTTKWKRHRRIRSCTKPLYEKQLGTDLPSSRKKPQENFSHLKAPVGRSIRSQVEAQRDAFLLVDVGDPHPTASVQPSGDRLRHLSPPHWFPAGVQLFRQGDSARMAYLIEQGTIKLHYTGEGGEEITAGVLKEGQIVGAGSIVLEEPYPATAITYTPCMLRLYPAESLRRVIALADPLIAKLVKSLSREAEERRARCSDLGLLSARHRLEQMLWEMFDSLQSSVKRLAFRHQERAQEIAIRPSYLSQLLGRMEAEGILRRDKGWLVIIAPERLPHR